MRASSHRTARIASPTETCAARRPSNNRPTSTATGKMTLTSVPMTPLAPAAVKAGTKFRTWPGRRSAVWHPLMKTSGRRSLQDLDVSRSQATRRCA